MISFYANYRNYEIVHILFITRHYPPEISGGARRSFLMTRALREAGHRVTLITPFNLQDADSINVENFAISRGFVNQMRSPRRYEITRKSTHLKNILRQWLYWPDDNIPWARSVVRASNNWGLSPDWIFTTSPSESVHYAGYKLSQRTQIPWAAEMRDTWTVNPHRRLLETSNIRSAAERYLARKFLSKATAITTVSEAVMNEARRYVAPNTPECIIPHFSNKARSCYQFDSSTLNLVHTGGFSQSDHRRQLNPLLEILDDLSIKRPEIVFHIAGPLSNAEQDLIQRSATTIKWHGLVPLEQSLSMQCGADGLILYSPPESHALPGKYAEYIMANRPVFYFGEGDWLNLALKPNNLRPLGSGVLNLEKNEKLTPVPGATGKDAAKAMIDFLERALPANRTNQVGGPSTSV